MSKVTYRKGSPYANTPQTSWFLSLLNYRPVPADSSDKLTLIEGKYENRPDLLSYDLYGTTDYWWVFMILNPDLIKDPIYDLKAGMTIYTALPDRLSRVLGG